MKLRLYVILFALLLLVLPTGCNIFNKTPAPDAGGKPTAATQLGTVSSAATIASIAAADAQAKKDLEAVALLTKVKAGVITARASNQGNPDGIPKVKVEGALAVTESRLDNVVADPVELAEQRSRDLLVEQGKVAEAREATARAISDGKAQAAEVAKAQAATDQAVKERDAARASELREIESYKATMARNAQDFDRRLREANDAATANQVKILTWAGVACILLFGLGLGFGGPAGLKMTWPFAIFGLICFGLAQIVALWWFKWAVLGSVLVGLAAAGWWVWKQHSLGTLKSSADEKAVQFNALLSHMIPALDKAYEAAEQSTKDILDKTIFDPLSKKLDRNEKSLVHSIRASKAQQEPPAEL